MLRKLFSLSYLQVDQPIKIRDRDKLNNNCYCSTFEPKNLQLVTNKHPAFDGELAWPEHDATLPKYNYKQTNKQTNKQTCRKFSQMATSTETATQKLIVLTHVVRKSKRI